MRSLLRMLFAIFLSYHLLSILVGLIPKKSAFNAFVQPHFQWYVRATGTRQSWAMFTTIPYNHKQNIALKVLDHQGNWVQSGVLLPDLAPYDSGYFRYHTSLSRMRSKKYKSYLKAYVDNVKSKLEHQRQIKIKSITVRYIYDRLRKPASIRRNGQISIQKEIVEGPFTWD